MHQRAAPSLAPLPYEGDDRWAYVAAVLTALTLESQRPLIRSIVPPQDENFVGMYAIGALLGSATMDPDALVLLESTDLSIVLESLAVAGRLPEDLTALLLPPLLVGGRPKRARPPWDHIREQLPSRRNAGLAGFQRAIQNAKHAHTPLFGPDIFSILQALAEPAVTLDEYQLPRMLDLASRWGLSDIFIQLMTLRLIGPYETEHNFLRRQFDTVQQTVSARHAELIGILLNPGLQPGPPPGRPMTYFEAVTEHYLSIRTALHCRDPSALIDAVIDLYSIDPALVGFLPWDRVSRAVGELLGMDARTAFMTFLMTEDAVRSRYPKVALRFGKGALIADLLSLIDARGRADAVNALLGRVATLPDRPAEALTRAILDRPIIERLASSLPPSRQIRTIRGNDRHRISLMTLNAVRLANQRKLVPEPDLRRRYDREIDALRFDLLQGRLRTGRVRVEWDELAKEITNLFDQDLPVAAMQIGATAQLTGLAPRLAAYSARQITTHILEISEHGLNQALSSNLRHGIVLPRYLKAFDDALQAVWPKLPLITWDEASVSGRMGEEGLAVLELRDRVSDLMKTFMDDRLTVESDGRFAAKLQERIQLRLTAHFAAGGTGRGALLPRTIVNAARSELRHHLRAAVRSLNEDVRRTINADVKAIRRRLAPKSRHEVRSFIDSLETCLHQAHEAIREWTALVSRTKEAHPFTLPDIVALHLMSTALNAWVKLKVQTRVMVDGVDRSGLEIRGELLVFFEEVVRNLLSNAFKGSGDELKTQAEIRLTVVGDRMILRCTNAINPNRIEDVIARQPDTVAQARRRVAGEAQKDHKSGFQKIRLAYKQTVRSQPTINIPPVSRRTARFVIELESALPPGGLFWVRSGS